MTSEDRLINPELQRFLAKRMRATTVEIKSTHLPFLSRPADVASVILAARSVEVGDRERVVAGSALSAG